MRCCPDYNSVEDKDSDGTLSTAAVAHGKLRFRQGYTPSMLIHESRILQVTVFGTLQKNLNSLDFRSLLPDVMSIADEVDAQLTLSMNGYMEVVKPKVVELKVVELKVVELKVVKQNVA